jgi:serine/threonine protein phosphatase 1
VIYAIGDLHGRSDLLVKALAAIEEHRDGQPATLVVLGDFVDRGPDSAGLIELLRANHGYHGDLTTVVLQGNHEDMMVKAMAIGQYRYWDHWLGNGGWQTLQSYGLGLDWQVPIGPFDSTVQDDLRWLARLPYCWETKHHVFVHAGLESGVSLRDQAKEVMQWHCHDRNWLWPDEHAGVHRDADFPKHVVHGHEQWAKGPILLPGRTDLDTFAWLTGRAAIGVFDETVPGGPAEILWAEGPATE